MTLFLLTDGELIKFCSKLGEFCEKLGRSGAQIRGSKRHINIWNINNFSVTLVTDPPGGVPEQKCLLGRTPKGSYSPRGCSRPLLETPFSEPLRRTLLRTLVYCKTIAEHLLRTLLRTLPQNPFQNLLRTLLRTLCCRTTP